uniref:Uncharacterized protein n=1 Tax=Cucumis melo TaxID=3656 RepID=A0A9I9E5P8_CUCME
MTSSKGMVSDALFKARIAQHRWPNKPPISGRNEYGFTLGRLELVKTGKLAEEKRWIKEEVQNYKGISRTACEESAVIVILESEDNPWT